MRRRYETPAAFKQAAEQRLRNAVASSGMELTRLRQRLVFDRFMARIVAVFRDRVILKGGFAVELRLERARTTKDIDLRLIGSPDDTLPQLREAGRLDLGDYLRFEVRADPRHPEIEAEGMRYQGLRYRASALLAGKIYGSPFGVDIAFAEPLVGEADEVAGSPLLSFAGIQPVTFRLYPLEAHIAEKLHAYTIPRDRPNSRVKDLPDIALLASVRSLDGGALRRAIRHTFEHRGTHPVPSETPRPPSTWAPVYSRIATTDGLPWATLDEVVGKVRAFLNPVLLENPGRWIPDTWAWHGDERPDRRPG